MEGNEGCRQLGQIPGRQRRFQTDTSHCIAKRAVAKAKGTSNGIALEDLLGIASGETVGRRQRGHANCSLGQLRAFIADKAQGAGVPVVLVDPRTTSCTCLECGTVDKANRRSQAEFQCVSCGLAAPADHNAARLIRARAVVMQPKVSDSGNAPEAPGTSRLLSLAVHDSGILPHS